MSHLNCLVTGGAGFIGSHLVERLVSLGHQVLVFDNLSSGKEENLKAVSNKISWLHGDIRDFSTCQTACRDKDLIFHMAALGSVPRSVDDPMTTNAVNIDGTLNLLVAAKEQKIRRFVFSSSSSVYGDSDQLPKVETMTPAPLSPYALSKLTGEHYLKLFNELYGLPTISLRYFNVFGPKQDPQSQYAAVIPAFIASLLEAMAPTIHGDGEQARDFTFVDDVIGANLLAGLAPAQVCGRVYNIACNRMTSINELFRLIREFIGQSGRDVKTIKPIYGPPRAGDVRASRADFSLASKYLRFNPQVSMEDGMARTVDWFLRSLR